MWELWVKPDELGKISPKSGLASRQGAERASKRKRNGYNCQGPKAGSEEGADDAFAGVRLPLPDG